MWGREPLPSPVCVGLQRANGAVTSSQRHSAAVHLAVHPPAREHWDGGWWRWCGKQEWLHQRVQRGPRWPVMPCYTTCPYNNSWTQRTGLVPNMLLASEDIKQKQNERTNGLDTGRHALPSLRACSTRADSSFHFVSALLARRCVSSTWAGVTVGFVVSMTGKGFTHLSFQIIWGLSPLSRLVLTCRVCTYVYGCTCIFC